MTCRGDGEVGGALKREGIRVYKRLIQDIAWQKLTQLCKAIIFQKKKIIIKKEWQLGLGLLAFFVHNLPQLHMHAVMFSP